MNIDASDRRLVAEAAAKGMVSPATGGYIPLGMPGHRPDTALPYDPERAGQLLAEAGYPGGAGLPRLKAIAYKGYIHYLELFEQFWSQGLGLKIEWEFLDWQEYLAQQDTGEVDLFVEGVLAETPNPDSLMDDAWIPSDYWTGETFWSLVAEAKSEMDPAKRLTIYNQIEERLLQEIPFFPLHYMQYHYLKKPWVHNYRPEVIFLDGWKDVIIEPH